jgi:hypothetical protein
VSDVGQPLKFAFCIFSPFVKWVSYQWVLCLLYIFWIVVLSNKYVLMITSVCGCHFILLTEQKILILVKSNIIFFFFYESWSWSCTQKLMTKTQDYTDFSLVFASTSFTVLSYI